jgi:hypothetical protein
MLKVNPHVMDTSVEPAAAKWHSALAYVLSTIGAFYIGISPTGLLIFLSGGSGWSFAVILGIAIGVSATIAGALAGAIQWRTLRRWFPWTDVWIGGTTLGLGSGVGLSMFLAAGLNGFFYILVFLPGIGLGMGQWLFLRRHLPGSGWWIGAIALTWLAGSLVLLGSLYLLQSQRNGLELLITPQSFILSLILMVIVTTIIMHNVLLRLVAQASKIDS